MLEDFSLDDDPRWRRLKDEKWTCSGCGVRHAGVIDLACGKPEQWPGGEDKLQNGNVATSSHFLSEDFCVLEGQHFELEPTDHPLAVEQRHGITLDRLLDVCALNGHDIRKDLVD